MGTRSIPIQACIAVILMSLPAFAADQWLPVQSPTPTLAQVALESNRADGFTLRFATPGLQLRDIRGDDARDYVQLSIPGCGAASERFGQPELPFKGFFLEFPAGTMPVAEIVALETADLGGGYQVYPWQLPPPDEEINDMPPFQRDAAAYAQNAFLPAVPVVLDVTGVIRGRHVVFAQIFPIQCNPGTGELRAITAIEVDVRFEGQVDPVAAAARARLATPNFEQLAESIIVNYEPIEAEPMGGMDGLSTGPAADYLVITADKYYEEVLPLAEWKHKKGVMTRVAKISETGNTFNAIKAFIKDAYDNWNPAPEYVLLVGDIADVPSGTGTGLSCTSDHGYACVDGTDYYADVTLARISPADEADCFEIVTKLLTYDRTPDGGNWYHSFLAAAEFEDNGNNGWSDRWFMETAMTVYDFLVNEQGWGGHTALCPNYWPMVHPEYHFRQTSYPHRETLNMIRWGVGIPDPIPTWITDRWTDKTTATADVSAGINAGVSVVQHRDHGGTTGWSMPPYSNTNVNALTNGVMTPVIFSLNCSTGSFQSGECFCEAFLRKYPGGAVGAVGATRTSYSGYNDLIANGIYTCMFAEYDTAHSGNQYERARQPAAALNYGKYYMAMYEGHSTYTEGESYMFHYFGDPEMNLRTQAPVELTVSYPSSVPFGEPVNVAVSVQAGGAPREAALVAISHPTAEGYWRGLTNAAGEITFEQITFVEEVDYDIVVTALDARPFEGVIEVDEIVRGDTNCDGMIDFMDINPFVLALTDPIGYLQQHPDCSLLSADINRDGKVDFRDINAFVELILP